MDVEDFGWSEVRLGYNLMSMGQSRDKFYRLSAVYEVSGYMM